MDRPTREQERAIADAAYVAARNKAVELGLPPICGAFGIARAMEGIDRIAALSRAIGVGATIELGKALRREADVIRQAEDILKGEK